MLLIVRRGSLAAVLNDGAEQKLLGKWLDRWSRALVGRIEKEPAADLRQHQVRWVIIPSFVAWMIRFLGRPNPDHWMRSHDTVRSALRDLQRMYKGLIDRMIQAMAGTGGDWKALKARMMAKGGMKRIPSIEAGTGFFTAEAAALGKAIAQANEVNEEIPAASKAGGAAEEEAGDVSREIPLPYVCVQYSSVLYTKRKINRATHRDAMCTRLPFTGLPPIQLYTGHSLSSQRGGKSSSSARPRAMDCSTSWTSTTRKNESWHRQGSVGR